MLRRLEAHDPRLTADELRAWDRRAVQELGVPSLILMENAGRGAADLLHNLGIRGPVTICCGRGNNAGDGLVVARHLLLYGHAVRVLCWTDPEQWSGDPATNYRVLRRCGLAVEQVDPTTSAECLAADWHTSDWIVDALLGTGTSGDPREPLARVIHAINSSVQARVCALDLPSGLNPDSGRPGYPTVRATVTCTFGAAKIGFDDPQAREYTGEIWLSDIGVPYQTGAYLHRPGE